jgi:murein DD-endopeptidase MepM/ murein hydrolase activator NlpD
MAAQNSALRGQLYTAELRMRNVEETNEASEAQGAEVKRRLAAAEEQLGHQTEQRVGLAARIHHLEAEASTAGDLKASLDGAEKRNQQVTRERDLLVAERDRLKRQLADLEQNNAEGNAVAVAEPASPPARAAQVAVGNAPAAQSTMKQGWGELERVLRTAGVDVEKLLARFNTPVPAQGGPYVAFDPLKRRPAEVPLTALQNMAKALPLAAPLKSEYQLESRFGVRVDPFNHRRSLHAGLDFSAPVNTPVFTTAPGTVVFAGAKGEYGRVVEVDHGSGIVTRYAHLHRTTVIVGQRLGGREQIGLLGSSGRSTGPHVHYEILVNGVAQDPERFLNAGRSVLQHAAAVATK